MNSDLEDFMPPQKENSYGMPLVKSTRFQEPVVVEGRPGSCQSVFKGHGTLGMGRINSHIVK